MKEVKIRVVRENCSVSQTMEGPLRVASTVADSENLESGASLIPPKLSFKVCLDCFWGFFIDKEPWLGQEELNILSIGFLKLVKKIIEGWIRLTLQ